LNIKYEYTGRDTPQRNALAEVGFHTISNRGHAMMHRANIPGEQWWIDSSFAVYPNLRGHTGAGLSMGQAFPITNSGKHKINTRSSTESEIVGVDDMMPAVCWTRYFMEAQGYGVDDSQVLQDNRSSILLEKNGKASSSKRTKHINIRYFFVTDQIAMNELSVHWCPTEEMIVDFATKPLQGALFRKFRDQIMGIAPIQAK